MKRAYGIILGVAGALALVTAILAFEFGSWSSAAVEITAAQGKTEYQGRPVDHFTFTPPTLTIKKGSTVTWRNGDGANRHTVTGNDDRFDSGILEPGRTYSFTFSQPGTYRYHCTIHPWATGAITVTD